ncbi:hybrid sensor histidine kinase/response regulator transcription factor [uncultured Bacteroides sp.]|uniref:hybrid sensor histidine kinase/response regulator transcription factor n=1 Tax=uncultured Bacteroides sp. TaxID=162156 RepID=UPI002590D232|nr:hybrid sensor histidine kinase/response regulator transcription factor [uncultured Bacteroides sp.]
MENITMKLSTIKVIRLLLFIVLLLNSPLHAQDHYAFTPIDCSDGLSGNRVRNIIQLRDGRIAINANEIVSIYDGTSFQYFHYNKSNIIPLNDYVGHHRIYVNEDYIYIKDWYKLMAININEERFEQHLDSLFKSYGVKGALVNFFVDEAGNYWMLTDDDVLLYRDYAGGKTVEFLKNVSMNGDERDRLLDIAVVNQQVFLFYNSSLMVCYDLETSRELYREYALDEKQDISATLLVVPRGKYLYYLMNGRKTEALRFDIELRKWEVILETEYRLNVLSVGKEHDIWITSQAGLWVCDEKLQNKQFIPTLEFIDGKEIKTEVSTVFNDNQGGTWIGTLDRGICYYHPNRFKFKNVGKVFFPNIDQNGEVSVSCFVEDAHGGILVGTRQGLLRYSLSESKLSFEAGLPRNLRCNGLTKDSRQRIWLSSVEALFCIQNGKSRSYPVHDVAKVFEAPDKNLYICSYIDGLCLLNPDTGELKKIEESEGRQINSVSQIRNYKEGMLIGICNLGLFTYDYKKQVLTAPVFKDKKAWQDFYDLHHYSDLYVDSRNLVWLATQDGLIVWNQKNEEIRMFYMENGLVNNSIQAISEDRHHVMWITTSYGISCVNVVQEGGRTEYSFSNFNHSDGVIEREFLERSVYVTKDDVILMGGIDGFNEFRINKLPPVKQDMKPLFVNFHLFGKKVEMDKAYDGNVLLSEPVSATQKIILNYDQNFVSFDFSALNYINRSQTHYRYRLTGLDKEWHEIVSPTGTGTASYANLPPGTYDLEVYAANNSKQWGSSSATIQIIVKNPYWKTPLAYFIYCLLIALSIYWALSSYLRMNKRKLQKAQEEELNQMKFRFFTNISHEFRTPLTLIITPLESLIKEVGDVNLKKKLQLIYRNSKELLYLVNQLLDFRRLEMQGEKLFLVKGNIVEFVHSVKSSFDNLAQEEKIFFEIEDKITEELYINFDREKILKVLNNLLSNAFKFTHSGGMVQVVLDTYEAPDGILYFRFSVKDTGVGIPRKELPHIFDRFYQVKNEEDKMGSGIGLHLVKEYVELHSGKIEVESEANKGSSFNVYLPIQSGFESGEVAKEDIIQDGQNIDVQSEKDLRANKEYTILLVEDNKEFRYYMSELLSKKYNVLEAEDGEEGEWIATTKFPDLIISDVMMPKVDGLELCKRIKSNIQVSHIPVILLTARSTDESKLFGYESGADEYISKPFNLDILLLRIQKLINEEKARQKSFSQGINIDPGEVTITSVDEQFIGKVCAMIRKNMDNPEYSVEKLSADVGMERTVLYRKLNAIAGQTPSDFIRSIRLKHAAQLLNKGYQVGEVADMVGFNTPKYFTKYFKQAFGVTPSQYKVNL